MKIPFLREKAFSTIFLIFFLFFTCGAFIATQFKIEDIDREKIPGSSIIYIPSGKFLKFATFGYSSLMADIIYMWAIQYYSNTSIEDRFKYLDHIFSIISELDPNYLDPYQIGALVATYEAWDLDLGFKILDRGLTHNPKQWIFPYLAGHYAQLVAKDYKRAQHYYKKAITIEGAPPIVKRLYADAAFKEMNYLTSWKIWLEIYKSAESERIKKIASNHLYQVKAAIDIKMIKEAIEKFRAKYHRNPMELYQLVKAGFLKSIPKDFDGHEYLYDSHTGEVKQPTIWWKR